MNSNSRLAVRLSPSSKVGKLIFSGRYPDEIEASFIIRNSYKHLTMFKVKTTAPELYCVRPNKGIIKPGDFIAIEIKIRPFPLYELLEVLKHYFKIQCVRAPAYMESFAHGWNESAGNKIVQTHYKCFFKIDEAPFGIRRILRERTEVALEQNTESSVYTDTSTETEILDTNGGQEEDDLPIENMEELDCFDADDNDIGDSTENDTEDNSKVDNTNIDIESSSSSSSGETLILDMNSAQQADDLPIENMEELDYFDADDNDIGDSTENDTEDNSKLDNTNIDIESSFSSSSGETLILDTNSAQEEDDLPIENMEEFDYFDADDANIVDSTKNDTEDNSKLDNTKQYYYIDIESSLSSTTTETSILNTETGEENILAFENVEELDYDADIESSLSSTTTETSILNTETGEENNLAFENLEELDYDADIEDSSDDGTEYSTKQHYTDDFMEQHDTDQENTESDYTQQDFTEYETFDGSVHFDQLIAEQNISEYESAEGPAHFDQLTAEQDISEHQSAEAPAHFDRLPASAPNIPRLAITLLMFAFAILLLAFIIMHFDSIVKYLRSIQFFGAKKPDGMIKKFFKLRLFKQ